MLNRPVLLYFLIILVICPLLMNSCAHDPNAQPPASVAAESSADDQSSIVSGDSQTAEDREREKRMKTEGTIAFDPGQYPDAIDPDFGQGQSVFISAFGDNREEEPGKHVGTLYNLVYHAPYVRLYNTEPVDLSLANAMSSLLSANGFDVKKTQDPSQKSIVIEGTINKLWVGLHHSIYGDVDIDIKIISPENREVIWSGKILKTKETETEKGGGYAAFYGVMGDGTELAPFLNALVSEAIVEAWNTGGMKTGFSKMAKKAGDRKALEKLAATEPAEHDAQANLKAGIAYYELSSFDNAAKYLKKASLLDPNSARIHYLLGSSYMKAGKKDLAIDQYEILKKFDANYAKKLFNEIYQN
jgi:hypothetical protein